MHAAVPQTVATKTRKKCSPQIIKTATVRRWQLVWMGTSHFTHNNRPFCSAGWSPSPRLTRGHVYCGITRLLRGSLSLASILHSSPELRPIGRLGHHFHLHPELSREAAGLSVTPRLLTVHTLTGKYTQPPQPRLLLLLSCWLDSLRNTCLLKPPRCLHT